MVEANRQLVMEGNTGDIIDLIDPTQDVLRFFTGKDPLTDNKLSKTERGMALLFIFPFAKVGKGFKFAFHGVEDVERLGKLENKMKKISSKNVIFKNKSIDKAFGKHGRDFGNYPNGGKASIEAFKVDVKKLIDTGIQKEGTWKGVKGIHIYDSETRLWTFINSDGVMNTAFKLSKQQFDYLVEKGVVK